MEQASLIHPGDLFFINRNEDVNETRTDRRLRTCYGRPTPFSCINLMAVCPRNDITRLHLIASFVA